MEKKAKSATFFLFFFYCISLLWLLFWRQSNPAGLPFELYIHAHVNLRPFRTIRLFTRLLIPPVRRYLVRIALQNLLGNIFLFTPLGIFLPALFPALRKFYRTVLAVFFIITVIELIQLVLMVGSCDIDDLMLNVTGAAIGYGMWKLHHFLTKSR